MSRNNKHGRELFRRRPPSKSRTGVGLLRNTRKPYGRGQYRPHGLSSLSLSGTFRGFASPSQLELLGLRRFPGPMLPFLSGSGGEGALPLRPPPPPRCPE